MFCCTNIFPQAAHVIISTVIFIIPEMILLNYYTYFSGIVKLYRKKRPSAEAVHSY